MPKRQLRVVCAVIVNKGRYLITQRSAQAALPLLWEFPGGRVEDGESDEAALCRELDYRLGLQAEVRHLISETTHEYDHYVISLCLYRCDCGPLPARPLMVQDLQWVGSDEFEQYKFTPADQAAMDALLFVGHTPH